MLQESISCRWKSATNSNGVQECGLATIDPHLLQHSHGSRPCTGQGQQLDDSRMVNTLSDYNPKEYTLGHHCQFGEQGQQIGFPTAQPYLQQHSHGP